MCLLSIRRFLAPLLPQLQFLAVSPTGKLFGATKTEKR